MSVTSKAKTIHYKSVMISGGLVLQDILKVAIGVGSKHVKPKSRQQKINPESEAVIFVNRFEDYNGISFGQLVTLEAGRVQRVITVDDDADYYTIDAMTSDKIAMPDASEKSEDQKAAKRREFLESVLYFGVLGNHMVLLQSAGLRTNNLEAHLTWLLGTHTGTMPNGSLLALNDKAAEETYQRLKRAPVKKVVIGAPLTSEQVIDPSDVKPSEKPPVIEETSQAARVRVVPSGAGAAMLMAALKDGFFDKLNLEEALDDANIQVALEVTYRRKTSKEGHRVLDSIATSLRHMPESDLRIDLEGGGSITGDQLKLSGGITVEFLDNGLINESLLFHAMHQWLQSKLASSEVDPQIGS